MQVPVPAAELLYERRLFVLHQAVDNLLPLLPLLPRHNRMAARDEGTTRLKNRNPEPLMLHADVCCTQGRHKHADVMAGAADAVGEEGRAQAAGGGRWAAAPFELQPLSRLFSFVLWAAAPPHLMLTLLQLWCPPL